MPMYWPGGGRLTLRHEATMATSRSIVNSISGDGDSVRDGHKPQLHITRIRAHPSFSIDPATKAG